MKERTEEEIKASEERMKPIVAIAEKKSKHFIASLGDLAIIVNGKYASQKQANEMLCKALDEAHKSFCEALVSGWMMMLIQQIENGIVDPNILADGKEVED